MSTDKYSRMFPRLEKENGDIKGDRNIQKIFQDPAFTEFRNINVLPLIYDEKRKRCNILVFDYDRAMDHTSRIVREEKGKGRKHVVHRFYDKNDNYICEVRYGDAAANAL